LSGGVLAVLIAGGQISIGSLFGFLILLGLAARYTLGMFHHMQQLEVNECMEFGTDLVLRAAVDRFRPVLMTTLGVLLVFIPITIIGAVPGLEIFTPMAIVVIGGLVTTILLELFISPALYLRYGMKRENVQEINSEHLPAD
jgi:Cu/Ag efflux pump CusA